jgi:ubiquinone/menaquinone biosynthesis C-methylase UbiE
VLFDWYVPFDEIFTTVENVIDVEAAHKILIVGVGRSNIIEVLYSKGYRDITAIDISPTVIHKMQQKYETYTGVTLKAMDVRELSSFPNGEFTLVIDKGCMDAIFGLTDFLTSVPRAYREIHRVMKNEAPFVSVSYAPAISRVPYLRCVQWGIEVIRLQEGEGLTAYVMLKTTNEEILGKRISGAEAAVREKSTAVIDGGAPGHVAGQLSTKMSVDALASMVNESAEVDG